MAPAIHPPCTPSASCAPVRCHPKPPVCSRPEKCLQKTISKGIRPCSSAASIMATRSKTRCTSCDKFKGADNPRKVEAIDKFLKRKSREAQMRKKDRLTGSHTYLDYTRKKGRARTSTACCAGKGHRGRIKRKRCAKCVIL